jgi:AmmeMemoRadiSam system protein B
VIDKEYLGELAEKFGVMFVPEAHAEHSTETQMPFIRHYLPDAKVVEIVYGEQDPFALGQMCDTILSDPQNAIVISTDLSHYYPLQKAHIIDSICIKAVADLDIEHLHQGCEACGKIGMEAIIYAAHNQLLEPKILDYRTSADASGDNGSVVGYMSAAFV